MRFHLIRAKLLFGTRRPTPSDMWIKTPQFLAGGCEAEEVSGLQNDEDSEPRGIQAL